MQPVTTQMVRDTLTAAGFSEETDSNIGFKLTDRTLMNYVYVEHEGVNSHQWVYCYAEALEAAGVVTARGTYGFSYFYIICTGIKEESE